MHLQIRYLLKVQQRYKHGRQKLWLKTLAKRSGDQLNSSNTGKDIYVIHITGRGSDTLSRIHKERQNLEIDSESELISIISKFAKSSY